jgi:predicted ribosomally synthesized peptide with nif11-like leader
MLAPIKISTVMSKEQLQTLLDQLKDDVDLQEKLKGAASLDAAVAIASSMGFDVSKADWLENKRLIGPHWLWEWDWI